MFSPTNRISDFLDHPPPESWGDRVLSGAESIKYSMDLVDGKCALGFELSGAVVGKPEDLFELMRLLDQLGGQVQPGSNRKRGAK